MEDFFFFLLSYVVQYKNAAFLGTRPSSGNVETGPRSDEAIWYGCSVCMPVSLPLRSQIRVSHAQSIPQHLGSGGQAVNGDSSLLFVLVWGGGGGGGVALTVFLFQLDQSGCCSCGNHRGKPQPV